MKQMNQKNEAQRREQPEPWEGDRPVPWLVLGVIAGLFIWSIGYIWFTHQEVPAAYGDRRTMADFEVKGESSSEGSIDGSKIYATHCVACHQANGEGVSGVFPPLADSEWVVGKPEVLVQIILHGISGELTVNGTTYSGEMPPFGDKLKDSEVAALATYLRTSMGNNESEVTTEEAAEQRSSVERDTPWGGDEDLRPMLE